MRVDDVLVRVNDTRIHYEVGVINVIKCGESFTRWFLGASGCKEDVLASPLPLSTKKFKNIQLQQVGFECSNHSTCIHWMTKYYL